MPSRGFGDAQAVTRTTDSPMRTMTAPSACLAYLPVSKEREAPLISSSRLYIYASEIIGDWAMVIGQRCPISKLLADAQAFDQIRVPLRILALQIVQQPAALPDEFEEASARVVIFRVGLEVLGEISDAFAQNGDLNFRGAGVGIVCTVRRDELGLPVFIECHECLPPRAGQKSVRRSPIRRNV